MLKFLCELLIKGMCVCIDLITSTNSSMKAKLNLITDYKDFSRLPQIECRRVKAQISELGSSFISRDWQQSYGNTP